MPWSAKTHKPAEAQATQHAKPYEATDRFLRTAAWRLLRLQHLAEHPLCKACLAVGRTTEATEVDHEEERDVAPERALDPTNLVSYCKPCHSKKTRRNH